MSVDKKEIRYDLKAVQFKLEKMEKEIEILDSILVDLVNKIHYDLFSGKVSEVFRFVVESEKGIKKAKKEIEDKIKEFSD